MTIIEKEFRTKGMTCNSCENIIIKQVSKLDGIEYFCVDYATEKAKVSFDDQIINFKTITDAIDSKGYTCQDLSLKMAGSNNKKRKIWAWAFALTGLLIIGYFGLQFVDTIKVPTISQNMGYGLLFVVGLLTGFHCVSMCGGFVVSYTTKGVKEGKRPHQMHASYALGKTISYTVIGALFGLLGSIIAFTPMMRGIAGIFAGLFLVLFGLKMLNVIPALRKFQLHLPKGLAKKIGIKSHQSSSPLVIGLLNGFMIACGPLQAIYIMAAGTGSMIEGAKLLFVFALGTLPVMLGFGYLTSLISSKATQKILKTAAVVVILLGLVMVNRGLALTGSGYDFNTITAGVTASFGDSSIESDENTKVAVLTDDGYQEIHMTVNRYGWAPDKFVIQKDVPVRWIIDGKEINGCNNAIQVPKLGLNFDIVSGEQIIEFTATETGTISWSCWMGMIPGIFIIEEDIGSKTDVAAAIDSVDVPAGGSCGGSSGGCGCGGARY